MIYAVGDPPLAGDQRSLVHRRIDGGTLPAGRREDQTRLLKDWRFVVAHMRAMERLAPHFRTGRIALDALALDPFFRASTPKRLRGLRWFLRRVARVVVERTDDGWAVTPERRPLARAPAGDESGSVTRVA